MTEAEWLACPNPGPMLEYLREKASARKRRLLACAGCRRIWKFLNQVCWDAIEGAERYADGAASIENLREMNAAVRARGQGWEGQDGPYDYDQWTWQMTPASAVFCATEDEVSVPEVLRWATQVIDGDAYYGGAYREQRDVIVAEEHRRHSLWVRDIFGNPSRPATVDPAWLRWNEAAIPRIAQAIYDERRFADLPILADALEEAGCTNADILEHCRSAGQHVRGCWVVDLVLGKE